MSRTVADDLSKPFTNESVLLDIASSRVVWLEIMPMAIELNECLATGLVLSILG